MSVIEDRDGGFVITGHNSTANVRPFRQFEGSSVYVVRTDQDGNVLWEKTYKRAPMTTMRTRSYRWTIAAMRSGFLGADPGRLLCDRLGRISPEA